MLVRRLPERPIEGVDYRIGNLGDPDAVDRAVAGAERVIHCGAATAGGWPEQYGSTVVGTRNVIEACRRHDVRQLVHISSMSVVDWAGARGGDRSTRRRRSSRGRRSAGPTRGPSSRRRWR